MFTWGKSHTMNYRIESCFPSTVPHLYMLIQGPDEESKRWSLQRSWLRDPHLHQLSRFRRCSFFFLILRGTAGAIHAAKPHLYKCASTFSLLMRYSWQGILSDCIGVRILMLSLFLNYQTAHVLWLRSVEAISCSRHQSRQKFWLTCQYTRPISIEVGMYCVVPWSSTGPRNPPTQALGEFQIVSRHLLPALLNGSFTWYYSLITPVSDTLTQ